MKARDRYYVQGVYCQIDGETMRVANLGMNGLFAVTHRPPSVGETVIVELQLSPKDSFRIIGEVSWVNPIGSPSTPELPEGFGVRFTRIASTDKETLIEVLKRADPVLGGTHGVSES
jgi:Tfp pilus assembly protein PilZ